jgi:hypothetical protein
MSRQYPTKQCLRRIADAAEKWAKTVRDNWPLWDATPAENPARFTFPETADTNEEKAHLARQLVDVKYATKVLKDLLVDVEPAHPLAGAPAGLQRCFPAARPTKNVVRGWPIPVSDAIRVLKNKVVGAVDLAMNRPPWQEHKILPIPNETVLGADWAVKALREAAAQAGPGGSRITKNEANVRAQEALKGRLPKGRKRWSERALATAIGCSPGLVHNLPAWKGYQESHCEKKTPAPKAVSLDGTVLDNKGQPDEELERLIADQQADFEESPLVSHARKHRRRPKV